MTVAGGLHTVLSGDEFCAVARTERVESLSFRALAEPMIVLPEPVESIPRAIEAGEDADTPAVDPCVGVYLVHSSSGSTYQVFADSPEGDRRTWIWRGSCPHHQQTRPRGGCKHIRRTRILVNEGVLPAPGEPVSETLYLRLFDTYDRLTRLQSLHGTDELRPLVEALADLLDE